MAATCDVRFSLQNRYAGGELTGRLRSLGISNDAVTIAGRAVIAGKEVTTVDAFADAEPDAIRDAFTTFLSNNELILRANSLVILDMEPPKMAPRHLGEYDVEEQKRLITGYRCRIGVVRELLKETGTQGLKLGLYQVIVPDPKGSCTDVFEERMWGYLAAGGQGMYDELDFICPVLYQRFGPQDGDSATLDEWNTAATRLAIIGSLALGRSNRRPIPLVPVLSLWVLSGTRPRDAVVPARLADQLTIVQRAERIDAILFWSGWETHEEMRNAPEPVEELDIDAFLASTGVLPWPGCPALNGTP